MTSVTSGFHAQYAKPIVSDLEGKVENKFLPDTAAGKNQSFSINTAL